MSERPWMDAELSADRRASLLLEEMTSEEKVALMTGDVLEGVEGFSNAGIDRLGIPPLRMADAGSGLRRPAGYSAATAMPAPIALAATWDADLGTPYGYVVGEESFLLRHNVMLGPNADLSRVPWSGRIGETVGEDPVLVCEMTMKVPAAVQRPGVLCCYKHPLAYNQETNRGGGGNSILDERTIREVYAPPFDAAIRAGAVSLMSSFNKINGVYANENDDMQNKLLRDAFGFAGFLMSDYLANHSLSPGAGLDMEEPGHPVEPTYYGPHLLWAVQNGSISKSVLDRACQRILWAMFVTGLFDTPLPEVDQPVPYAEHATIAREIEEAAITLLRNEGGVPPLGAVHSIAVIGADTDRPARVGGSSFVTIPADSVGILRGIAERAPEGVEVRSAPGTDPIASGDGIFLGAQPIASAFQSPPGQPGVKGVRIEYFENDELRGEPVEDRVEPDTTVNVFVFNMFHDMGRVGPPLSARSLRSTGILTVPATGAYRFTLSGLGVAKLWIDDVEAARFDSPWAHTTVETAEYTLEAGTTLSLRVEVRSTGGRAGGVEPCAVQLGWTHPDDVASPDIAAAAELARESDVAVVFVRTMECEQQDSATLSLARNQDAMVQAVAAANPNTVVVIGSGTPVLTPWTPDVAAVLQSYMGGQEQGHAIARVLFGDVNPSGKLPYTMARSEDQYETIGVANPVRNEWNRDVEYTEGLFIGYRGFEKHGLTPQFPFGHGLSYTRFGYDSLTVEPEVSDGTAPVVLRFTLTNTGERAGAEVAQAYLSVPEGHDEPAKKLVGFAKVPLEPGESREVELVIDPLSPAHPLSMWDAGAHLWRTISGTYTVRIGASSQDLRLSATFEVRAKEAPTAGSDGAMYHLTDT